MDTEWKESYASPTNEMSPVLKEVILIICLVSKNGVPPVPLLLFSVWLVVSVFQAGGDSCDVVKLWFM